MTPTPLLIIGTLGAGALIVAHFNDDEHSGIKKIYKKHRNIWIFFGVFYLFFILIFFFNCLIILYSYSIYQKIEQKFLR